MFGNWKRLVKKNFKVNEFYGFIILNEETLAFHWKCNFEYRMSDQQFNFFFLET